MTRRRGPSLATSGRFLYRAPTVLSASSSINSLPGSPLGSSSPRDRSADSTFSISEPHLAARGLACRRGTRLLFDKLDLALRPGELVWLRGRNGRGKTSLLRLLAGVATPEAGQVLLDGTPIGANGERSRRVTYLGHQHALKDDLTSAEALEFVLRIHGRRSDRSSVDAALEHWGMLGQRNTWVRRLSQGQRRRVALARLVGEQDASLWLLDEPFDSLDADGAERLNALLRRHLQRGGAVLLTGHQGALAPSLQAREFDLDRDDGASR
jgi:heme exporter protein A